MYKRQENKGTFLEEIEVSQQETKLLKQIDEKLDLLLQATKAETEG